MHPFDSFLEAMPYSKVVRHDDMLVYSCRSNYMLDHFRNKALNIIMRDKLPLVVEAERWSSKGITTSLNLVVSMAPEPHVVESKL